MQGGIVAVMLGQCACEIDSDMTAENELHPWLCYDNGAPYVEAAGTRR